MLLLTQSKLGDHFSMIAAKCSFGHQRSWLLPLAYGGLYCIRLNDSFSIQVQKYICFFLGRSRGIISYFILCASIKLLIDPESIFVCYRFQGRRRWLLSMFRKCVWPVRSLWVPEFSTLIGRQSGLRPHLRRCSQGITPVSATSPTAPTQYYT